MNIAVVPIITEQQESRINLRGSALQQQFLY